MVGVFRGMYVRVRMICVERVMLMNVSTVRVKNDVFVHVEEEGDRDRDGERGVWGGSS